MICPNVSRNQVFTLLIFLLITLLVTQLTLPKSPLHDTKRWPLSYFHNDAQLPVSTSRNETIPADEFTAREKYLIGVGKADITGYVNSNER